MTRIIAHHNSTSHTPATISVVTSGLALFPLPRCPIYSASKAALRSFILAVRRQLTALPTGTNYITLIECLPPAVETELHSLEYQPKLASAGVIGIPVDEYAGDLYRRLVEGKEDEIAYGTSVTGLEKIGKNQRYMVEHVMPAGV